ncbi:MAG: hypothetical protein GQ538_05640 [Xanthomonadales bacterium]|nr:hypothetical protein [Xanthomonadales bacterium]
MAEFTLDDRPERGVNGPIADTDLEQSNVRFRQKQTTIQIISPAQLL